MLTVCFGHLRVSPDLFHTSARLRRSHLDADIGRAVLAEPFCLVPALLPAYP